jgi:PTS system nitrogen regulatory IIA component
LLIPDNVTQQHLEILSEIAEMFSDKGFRSELAEDSDAQSLYTKLVNWHPAERNVV